MLNPIKKSFAYGGHTVTLETAEIARQAGGAVLVTMEDTMVLATVVAARKPKPGQSFFPWCSHLGTVGSALPVGVEF